MTTSLAWTFFYGSFIDLGVLREYGVLPQQVRVARLAGFDIAIRPCATLIEDESSAVCGILARVEPEQLDGLYGQDWVGRYRPRAVVVQTGEGALVPALCWIAPPSESAPAGAPRFSGSGRQGASREDYIRTIVDAARSHDFPRWYVDRLERLR